MNCIHYIGLVIRHPAFSVVAQAVGCSFSSFSGFDKAHGHPLLASFGKIKGQKILGTMQGKNVKTLGDKTID